MIADVNSSVNFPSSWESSDSNDTIWISTWSTSCWAIHTLEIIPVIVLIWTTRWVADASNGINVISRVGRGHNKSWSGNIAWGTELRAVYALSIKVLSSHTRFIASISSEINWKSGGGSQSLDDTISVFAGTSRARAIKALSSIWIIILSRFTWCVADGIKWIYNKSSGGRINSKNTIYNWARSAVLWARHTNLLIEVVVFALFAALVTSLVEAINSISILCFNNSNKSITPVTRRASSWTIFALGCECCG